MEMQTGQPSSGDTSQQYPKGDYPPPEYGQPHPQQPYPQQPYPQQPYPQQAYAAQPGVLQPGVPGAAATTVVIQQGVARPQSFLILSCFVIWCCNLPMGIIAFVFSLMSSKSADRGDMVEAHKLGRISMWVNVAAIIITGLLLIVLLVIYAVYLGSIFSNLSDPYYK